jgi:hypothetical protein
MFMACLELLQIGVTEGAVIPEGCEELNENPCCFWVCFQHWTRSVAKPVSVSL